MNLSKIEFEKDLTKGMNCSFCDKTMEEGRNRLKLELVKNDDDGKSVKLQSCLTFYDIPKFYENFDTYTSKQRKIMIDKPMCLGCVVLDLSNSSMYVT